MDTMTALRVYKELADWHERQGQPAMRDRFLILAAEAALTSSKPEEAERLRQRLLQGNPHHMLKPFSSFAQAAQSSNVQIYIHDLQSNYPPEKADELLHDLRGTKDATGIIPVTAAEIEVPEDPTLPMDVTVDSLKVYPLRPEPERSPKPLQPTHLNRPAATKKPTASPTSKPVSRPATPRPPVARVPAAPSPPRVPEPESTTPGGAWLTLLLFGMTVTAGAALAAWALARPFLPREWLP